MQINEGSVFAKRAVGDTKPHGGVLNNSIIPLEGVLGETPGSFPLAGGVEGRCPPHQKTKVMCFQ